MMDHEMAEEVGQYSVYQVSLQVSELFPLRQEPLPSYDWLSNI